MKFKNKEVIAFGLTVLMALGIVGFTPSSSKNATEEKAQTTSFSDDELGSIIVRQIPAYEDIVKEATIDAETLKNIKLDKYDDDFYTKTYYVHSNDKRTILSQNDFVEGYELQSIYTSFSSAEEIVYMITDNKDGTFTCKTVSYDDIEKIPDRSSIQLYVINEESPVDAFISCIRVNNDKGTSKKMNNY